MLLVSLPAQGLQAAQHVRGNGHCLTRGVGGGRHRRADDLCRPGWSRRSSWTGGAVGTGRTGAAWGAGRTGRARGPGKAVGTRGAGRARRTRRAWCPARSSGAWGTGRARWPGRPARAGRARHPGFPGRTLEAADTAPSPLAPGNRPFAPYTGRAPADEPNGARVCSITGDEQSARGGDATGRPGRARGRDDDGREPHHCQSGQQRRAGQHSRSESSRPSGCPEAKQPLSIGRNARRGVTPAAGRVPDLYLAGHVHGSRARALERG